MTVSGRRDNVCTICKIIFTTLKERSGKLLVVRTGGGGAVFSFTYFSPTPGSCVYAPLSFSVPPLPPSLPNSQISDHIHTNSPSFYLRDCISFHHSPLPPPSLHFVSFQHVTSPNPPRRWSTNQQPTPKKKKPMCRGLRLGKKSTPPFIVYMIYVDIHIHM